MSSSVTDGAPTALDDAARTALAAAEQALTSGATADIPDETVQRLLTAGTRLFARKVEMENRYFLPVTDSHAVTATDVAVTVTDMLRAVNLNLFDLSMWAGRPRDED